MAENRNNIDFNKLVVIRPMPHDCAKMRRFNHVLDYCLTGEFHHYSYMEIHGELDEYLCSQGIRFIETAEELEQTDIRGKVVLFAVALGMSGINIELYKMIRYLRCEENAMEGCIGGMFIDADSELYTKATARDLVMSANRAGCMFPGRSLVEGTESLQNYYVVANLQGTDSESAYCLSARDLLERMFSHSLPTKKVPKVLALHAGNKRTSNTLGLWHLVKYYLQADVKEISLRDGEVYDCKGCSYETCLHMGEQQSCFYGGVVTQEVYPAVSECDAVVMICPNYNDAISANLSAFVNRLTALYRVKPFYEKRLFAVIVSGYSGSDIVGMQLISALNMNKAFTLPPKFSLMETANDPLTIQNSAGIQQRAEAFAERMNRELCGEYYENLT